jgi:hypothetical protein
VRKLNPRNRALLLHEPRDARQALDMLVLPDAEIGR